MNIVNEHWLRVYWSITVTMVYIYHYIISFIIIYHYHIIIPSLFSLRHAPPIYYTNNKNNESMKQPTQPATAHKYITVITHVLYVVHNRSTTQRRRTPSARSVASTKYVSFSDASQFAIRHCQPMIISTGSGHVYHMLSAAIGSPFVTCVGVNGYRTTASPGKRRQARLHL